mgnify:CR=1 FL=1
MVRAIRKFRDAEDGATAIEYGLIAALVALTLIASLAVLGGQLDTLFQYFTGVLNQANSGSTP